MNNRKMNSIPNNKWQTVAIQLEEIMSNITNGFQKKLAVRAEWMSNH